MELQGIPTSAQEDLNEIVKNIGSIVDVCIEDKDISSSHRLKSDSATPPIIFKFTCRCFRDHLYKARSKLNDLTIEDIGQAVKVKIRSLYKKVSLQLEGICFISVMS